MGKRSSYSNIPPIPETKKAADAAFIASDTD